VLGNRNGLKPGEVLRRSFGNLLGFIDLAGVEVDLFGSRGEIKGGCMVRIAVGVARVLL